MIWENFKDWLVKSWMDHPLFTTMFGVICFVVGGVIF